MPTTPRPPRLPAVPPSRLALTRGGGGGGAWCDAALALARLRRRLGLGLHLPALELDGMQREQPALARGRVTARRALPDILRTGAGGEALS